ncbi:hypothetical protein [Nocardia suismassiliense]|uniref:hypothetical protein n=1 Tax=Nocardia suismassiliense TaxID=2077092 RepID=UPI001F16309B|nr:hypothetical protein [Nocardia suismassiliense]
MAGLARCATFFRALAQIAETCGAAPDLLDHAFRIGRTAADLFQESAAFDSVPDRGDVDSAGQHLVADQDLAPRTGGIGELGQLLRHRVSAIEPIGPCDVDQIEFHLEAPGRGRIAQCLAQERGIGVVHGDDELRMSLLDLFAVALHECVVENIFGHGRELFALVAEVQGLMQQEL